MFLPLHNKTHVTLRPFGEKASTTWEKANGPLGSTSGFTFPDSRYGLSFSNTDPSEVTTNRNPGGTTAPVSTTTLPPSFTTLTAFSPWPGTPWKKKKKKRKVHMLVEGFEVGMYLAGGEGRGLLTDGVEDDVVLVRQVLEVLLGVVDGDIGAEALEELQLRRARRRRHLGRAVHVLGQLQRTGSSFRPCESEVQIKLMDANAVVVGVWLIDLDGEGADAAGAAEDEDGLAGGEAGALEALVGGLDGERQPGGLREAEALGLERQQLLLHGGVLRQRPRLLGPLQRLLADVAVHLVPFLQPLHLPPGLHHHAGHVVPRHRLRRASPSAAQQWRRRLECHVQED
uniref:Uncharacterized protein n=1 Tax=Oryza meridionalis TaxID=40149 RepID=A0A0E0EL36_9ORYZ